MAPNIPAQKAPLLKLLETATLIKQGAEARVYRADIYQPIPSTSTLTQSEPPPPLLLKHRFPKAYRHPQLDAQLTRSRIAQEARCLVRCAKYGVEVPGVRCVDVESGILGIEWIDGRTVRDVLGAGDEGDELVEDDVDGEVDVDEVARALEGLGLSEDRLLNMIGVQIAMMHLGDIVHGDLTTSNMMVRSSDLSTTARSQLVLVDFGLAHVSSLIEDKAVDLYVLERALISTHPEPEPADAPADHCSRFDRILAAYADRLGAKEWKRVGTRLEDVRMRGRKRSMVG